MPLPDYQDTLIQLQLALGKVYLAKLSLLNLPGRTLSLHCSFVEADFIDWDLRLYAGLSHSLEISEWRIVGDCRARLELLFENKTPLRPLVFAEYSF